MGAKMARLLYREDIRRGHEALALYAQERAERIQKFRKKPLLPFHVSKIPRTQYSKYHQHHRWLFQRAQEESRRAPRATQRSAVQADLRAATEGMKNT